MGLALRLGTAVLPMCQIFRQLFFSIDCLNLAAASIKFRRQRGAAVFSFICCSMMRNASPKTLTLFMI